MSWLYLASAIAAGGMPALIVRDLVKRAIERHDRRVIAQRQAERDREAQKSVRELVRNQRAGGCLADL